MSASTESVAEYRNMFEALRVAWPEAHAAFEVVALAQLDLARGGPVRHAQRLIVASRWIRANVPDLDDTIFASFDDCLREVEDRKTR